MRAFRHAFRTLAKTPGFTAAATLVLALGIGANTAVFSVVYALLLAPPAYPRPAEIVQVFSQDKKHPKNFRGFSYATYRDIRAQNSVFADTAAFNLAMVGLGRDDSARRAFVALVSSSYFSTLGVAPLRGRVFLPEEETPGRPAEVAVVSYRHWKKHGFDPALVGSPLVVNGRTFTIVGIMPPGFTGTMSLFSNEVWLPLSVYDQVANDFQGESGRSLSERAGTPLLILGRLRPGLTSATADHALAALAAQLERAFPVIQKDQTFLTAPLARSGTSTAPADETALKSLGVLLLGMAAVVLLVACLNLANMLLARGTARRKEVAIRLALGGGRWQIVRQFLVEGFLLSLFGGTAGLLLALWSSDLLVASLTRIVPLELVLPTGAHPALLLATLGFCLGGTLLFALGPALKATRGQFLDHLKSHAGEDVARPRHKFLPRHPLVVLQIALSLALLTAAALFLRGAQQAANVDTGLRADRDFLVELDANAGRTGRVHSLERYRTLGEKLAALPGVESASISSTVPFGMVSLGKSVRRAGVNPGPDDQPATTAAGLAFNADWNSVGADYFRTVGLPLLRGRAFTVVEATSPDAPAVAIIDDVLARELWPDGDALGQRIQFPGKPPAVVAKSDATTGDIAPGETIEIVGIVPTVRHSLFDKTPGGALYLPFARGFQSNAFFHVKFAALPAGAETAAAAAIRQTIRQVDPALPILSLRTFAQHLDANVQLWLVRAGAAMFSVFGGLALLLAVVGVYGVKAYAVARRTREIGIRMALGADRSAVLRLILGEGAVMLSAGVILGLALAAGTGQLVSKLLYQVGALDPVAFIVAPLLLAAATFVASWLPARRATRISPVEALRSE